MSCASVIPSRGSSRSAARSSPRRRCRSSSGTTSRVIITRVAASWSRPESRSIRPPGGSAQLREAHQAHRRRVDQPARAVRADEEGGRVAGRRVQLGERRQLRVAQPLARPARRRAARSRGRAVPRPRAPPRAPRRASAPSTIARARAPRLPTRGACACRRSRGAAARRRGRSRARRGAPRTPRSVRRRRRPGRARGQASAARSAAAGSTAPS